MSYCCVCRLEKEYLISLSHGDGAESIEQMLSKFMNTNIEHMSKYICLSCSEKLEITYNFNRTIEKSAAKTIQKYSAFQYHLDNDDTSEAASEENSLLLPMYTEPEENGKLKRQLRCVLCDRPFRSSVGLDIHVKRHAEIKHQPKCIPCKLQFIAGSHYHQHMELMH